MVIFRGINKEICNIWNVVACTLQQLHASTPDHALDIISSMLKMRHFDRTNPDEKRAYFTISSSQNKLAMKTNNYIPHRIIT